MRGAAVTGKEPHVALGPETVPGARLGARGTIVVATRDASLELYVARTFRDSAVHVARWSLDVRALHAQCGDFDVAVLDDQSPSDTFMGLRHLRRGRATRQVVCVNVSNAQRVRELLDLGADDAVLAGSDELVCRLHAVLRRAMVRYGAIKRGISGVSLEARCHTLHASGLVISLSPRESAMLNCLLGHCFETVTPKMLHEQVWGGAFDAAAEPLVRVYIGYLRRKLAPTGTLGIRTVRGKGYCLESELC